MRQRAKKKLDKITFHPITPVLSDFPFVGATQYLYIYVLFSEEQMHILQLGVSRTLNGAVVEQRRSTTHTTDQ